MKHNKIQLMVYGNGFEDISAKFNNDDIKILNLHFPESPNYLFIDIEISPNARAQEYTLSLRNQLGKVEAKYPIYEKGKKVLRHQGFNSKDIIYLIMPDRFVNGDPANDNIGGFADSAVIPDNRQGGDLQGIISKLEYLKELGITTIWSTPMVENKTWLSYHGYSATNFYSIDPRIGTNELYKEFVNKAHAIGLKVILDHVSNHLSIDHPWMKTLPYKDWINGTPEDHLAAMHHKMVFTDIYGDSSSINQATQGWFIGYMPDLNQRNPYLARYIIQNTIWWVEYAGIDGIREDTYPYNDQKFMAEWTKQILQEYPALNIVGEVWTGESVFLAPFQKGSPLKKDFDTNLPVITDFGIRDAYYEYLTGKAGLQHIYIQFAKDFIFSDPDNLLTFGDNHDIPRIMFYAKRDVKKVKNILLMLFTTRGIPQILYGTEIGLTGGEGHGTLRVNFPGGFPGDEKNAFTKEGRTELENDLFNYSKQLITFRKKYSALSSGKMIQFPVIDSIYFYFKVSDNEKIAVIINDSGKDFNLELKKYTHIIKSIRGIYDMLNDKEIEMNSEYKLTVSAGNRGMFLIR